jgi:hypothetical protein
MGMILLGAVCRATGHKKTKIGGNPAFFFPLKNEGHGLPDQA